MRQRSELTSSAVGSRASPSRSRASAKPSQTLDGYGRFLQTSFSGFARRSCSSKTSQGCGRPDCMTCWPTLPLSGSMRSGVVSPLPRQAPRIDEDACSFLPTPTASDYDMNMGGAQGRVGKPRYSLSSLARRGLLPTPTVKGDYNRTGLSSRSGDGLQTVIGGPLNPQFREWLMGFPVGWTAIVSREMPLSRNRRRSLGVSSPRG